VVVGAGLTGLAAARRLAERRPDWRVVTLEQERVGAGASGRNAGVISRVRPWSDALGAANLSLQRLATAGLEHLATLVRDHAIPCGWRDTPRIDTAAGARGARRLAAIRRSCEAAGLPCQSLAKSEVAARTGSVGTEQGLHTTTVTVQPVALVRGLAGALPLNTQLYEESPVRAIRGSAPFEVETPAGVVRAERVLLATNGAGTALGFPRRRCWPLHTFCSLSPRLSDAELRCLGETSGWTLVSADARAVTLRLTSDGRLFLRHGFDHAARRPPRRSRLGAMLDAHRALLTARFPALPQIPLEFVWSGTLAMTTNGLPWFGPLASGVYTVGAYSGNGLALGTAAGILLADLVLEADSPLLRDMQALPLPTRVLPGTARLHAAWRRLRG
jgi:glycine/D-amino acid oxidase-like deaminating enzyme